MRIRTLFITMWACLVLGTWVIPLGFSGETLAEPRVRVDCLLSGKLFVGSRFLGNVTQGYQYPINNLQPGRHTIKIVGDTQTWETTVDITRGEPVTLKSAVAKQPTGTATAEPTPGTDTSVVETPPAAENPTPSAEIKEKRWEVQDLRLTLSYISPGAFVMGDSNGDKTSPHEGPTHTVTLTREFWMGQTEVTTAQFKALLPKVRIRGSEGQQPVVAISWWEAMDFCHALTKREAAKLPAGYQFRLPTEAEWEYCCRAGSTGRYFAGSRPELMEPYVAMDKTLATVATRRPNAFGLYDMVGNVQEWCLDAIPPRPREAPATYKDGIQDPVEMNGTARVIRGGYYRTSLAMQYSGYRKPIYPHRTSRGLGFRIVLAPILKEPSEGRKPRQRYK